MKMDKFDLTADLSGSNGVENVFDKNFEIKTALDEPDVKWHSVLEEPFDIYVEFFEKQLVRLKEKL